MTDDERGRDAAKPAAGVQAIERAIAVLEAFEDEPELTAARIAARVGLTSSTAHRIVKALQAHDLLVKSPGGDGYRLGVATALLGRLAADGLGVSIVSPHLEALRDRTGETINLGIRLKDAVGLVVSVASNQPLRVEPQLGGRTPIHACAMGKALLAFGDPTPPESEPYERFTAKTLTTRPALDEDLARIRERGYSLSDEERLTGVRSIGAPVRNASGKVVAAIAIQGPTVRLTRRRLPKLTQELAEITRALAPHIDPSLNWSIRS